MSGPRSAYVAAILVAASRAIFAQELPAPDAFEPVRGPIVDAIEEGQAPSLALAVLRGGKLVWAEGFGLSDRERGTRATADSIYLLASVSKPITATALMVAHDRGLVDLDAPANRYLEPPGLRAWVGDPADMTVRRLANHTSGLPVHWNFFYDGVAPPPMSETIRRYGFAATAPGSRWTYSNLGFGILQHITERVAGVPWRAFLEKELLDPLGMSRTSDRVRPEHAAAAAAPYRVDAAGRFVRVGLYDFDHPGASAIWSTANDLARFVRFHLGDGELDGRRVLSAESARAMRVPTGRRGSPGEGTGIGWQVGKVAGRTCIQHSGGMPGVSTLVRIWPESGDATIVLTNCSRRALTNEVSRRLQDVLFPPPSERAAPEAPAPERRASSPPIADLDGTWRGRLVHFDGDIALELRMEAGRARLRLGEGAWRALRELSIERARLSGNLEADLRTQDGFHGTPKLELRLEAFGDGARLAGIAVAEEPGYFALSHWVELERQAVPVVATEPAPPWPKGCLVAVGGGGTPKEVVARAIELAGGTEAKVAILPQASASAEAGESAAELWREHGLQWIRVVDFDDLERATETLHEASLIWMSGGDQSRLVEAVPEEVRKLLRQRYQEGAVIGGTSAGAAALSEVMITGEGDGWKMEPGATPTAAGLGLWTTVVIDQHHLQRRRLQRLLGVVRQHPRLVGIGIDERTAVIVSGSRIEVVGENKVVLVRGRAPEREPAGAGASGPPAVLELEVLTPGAARELTPSGGS